MIHVNLKIDDRQSVIKAFFLWFWLCSFFKFFSSTDSCLHDNFRTLWPIDFKFSEVMDMGKYILPDPNWPTYQRSKGQISLFCLITLERSGRLTSNFLEWWIWVRIWNPIDLWWCTIQNGRLIRGQKVKFHYFA